MELVPAQALVHAMKVLSISCSTADKIAGWSGALCSSCAPTNYGPSCLPLPAIYQVAPTFGHDVGGTVVTISGYNLNRSNSRWECRFGSTRVNATWLSPTKLTCVSPTGLSNTDVNVDVLENGTLIVRDGTVKFRYVGLCSDSACLNHGVCSLGKCICNSGWMGETCNIQVLKLQRSLFFSKFLLLLAC